MAPDRLGEVMQILFPWFRLRGLATPSSGGRSWILATEMAGHFGISDQGEYSRHLHMLDVVEF